ncbi:class I SAM-dependent methyltransferase [Amorphus orientalis]|uniref:Phosphatidylethanolamine/phosphatidyl-N-methylethanolamine N-methyltransferase n=1 Tax=Amorphus orientalis TaxID=649198 RepID=A0AAE4ARL6_9HYPH|nr:phospholipid methyltransferase [Amorphus orientalis]MDQ0314203.1 phosphatidylethanolamine/phosphatidyl-N-methylethanolamine N-methyltransferase [Amorphus orientalis]
MLAIARTHARRFSDRFVDEVRFLRAWVERPLITGAVAPSGASLSRLMASFVDADCGSPIVELGPGTGVVTDALVKRGIDESRLILIEYSPDFCALLAERFPRATIIEGDAYAMAESLGTPTPGSLAGVVSSLPLFTRPLEARQKLIEDALELNRPGAPFIQFSYALVPPVPEVHGRYGVTRTSWVVRNVPPARVWLYRRAVEAQTDTPTMAA